MRCRYFSSPLFSFYATCMIAVFTATLEPAVTRAPELLMLALGSHAVDCCHFVLCVLFLFLIESDLETQVAAVGSLVEADTHSWLSGMRDLHMTGMVGEVAVADGTLASSWVLRPDNNLGHFLCTRSFR